MNMTRRRGIAAAIFIFLVNFVMAGMAMIVVNEIVVPAVDFKNANPIGAYWDPNTFLFLVDGWFFMSLIVLIGSSVWLYLRAQEPGTI